MPRGARNDKMKKSAVFPQADRVLVLRGAETRREPIHEVVIANRHIPLSL
jgi:hypothetical protein